MNEKTKLGKDLETLLMESSIEEVFSALATICKEKASTDTKYWKNLTILMQECLERIRSINEIKIMVQPEKQKK